MKISDSQQEEYKAFLKNIREEREENPNIIKLIFTIVMAILLAIIVCVILVENNIIFNQTNQETGVDSNGIFKFSRKNGRNFNVPFSHKRQNILLLGIDSNGAGTDMWKGTRSDTIVVVNIDPKTRSIKAISIPRDSKVCLPEHSIQKINSAHALGGINLVKRTLKESFGIKIDKYIIVHDGPVGDKTAQNYYVRYKDYIKNVASSEIYATWPEATLYANILAIQSFLGSNFC